MKILVTGGAGFIGSHLSERLVKLGYHVVAIDDLSMGKIENLGGCGGEVEFHKVDICDLDCISPIFKGVDYVFHEAAINRVQRSIDNPISVNEVNVIGTLNVLMAARDNGIKKVIYASSSSVYGGMQTVSKSENMAVNPQSPYAVSKLAGEGYCCVFTTIFGLPTVSLRYFSIYGTRQRADIQYAAVIPKFIKLMNDGESVTIYGDGRQTRDFTFVEDVVDANILCLGDKLSGVYNVGNGVSVSINQVVQDIEQLLGKKACIRYSEARKGDWRSSLADITKIRCMGYMPKYDLVNGIRHILEEGA